MYKLQSETLGIVNDNTGKAVAITLPTDSVIDVVSPESDKGTIDVLWNNQLVNIFTTDLKQRAIVLD